MKKITKREKELKEIANRILIDKPFRIMTTKNIHRWFFATYFMDQIKYGIAPFQEEMFKLTQDDKVPLVVVEAFRGCGKTTIMVISYILWATLGYQQKKHILLASQSTDKAIAILRNVKSILETNKQLIADFGPFKIPPEPWKENSLHLPKYDAKIVPISLETSPRGYIHKGVRPDLVIIDDLESIHNINSVEMRDKAYRWFTEEVKPSGDRGTKYIITGNFLHSDSLIRRLQEQIETKKTIGVYKRYPFFDENYKPMWKSKFPTDDDVKELKLTVGDKNAWAREYLLKEISVGLSPITKNLIKYYDVLPEENKSKQVLLQYTGTGVDLAISKETSAHFTAMVSAKVFWVGDTVNVYILPNPLNLRVNFPETVDLIKKVSKSLGVNGNLTEIIVETVAYQEAVDQTLKADGYPVIGVKHNLLGKRERLSVVANFMANYNVYFPKQGADLLITQLLGFGSERYDDLADAFAMLMTHIMNRCRFYAYDWNFKPRPDLPVYRDFGGELVDMSKPFFPLDTKW